MDEQQQVKTIWESGLWDAALWLIAILWSAVTVLAARTWRKQEQRLDDLEEFCKSEHKQRGVDLTQQAVSDAATHDAIRKELATELRLVYDKIETNNNKSVERFDALSKQMTDQHGVLMEHVVALTGKVGGK